MIGELSNEEYDRLKAEYDAASAAFNEMKARPDYASIETRAVIAWRAWSEATQVLNERQAAAMVQDIIGQTVVAIRTPFDGRPLRSANQEFEKGTILVLGNGVTINAQVGPSRDVTGVDPAPREARLRVTNRPTKPGEPWRLPRD